MAKLSSISALLGLAGNWDDVLYQEQWKTQEHHSYFKLFSIWLSTLYNSQFDAREKDRFSVERWSMSAFASEICAILGRIRVSWQEARGEETKDLLDQKGISKRHAFLSRMWGKLDFNKGFLFRGRESKALFLSTPPPGPALVHMQKLCSLPETGHFSGRASHAKYWPISCSIYTCRSTCAMMKLAERGKALNVILMTGLEGKFNPKPPRVLKGMQRRQWQGAAAESRASF